MSAPAILRGTVRNGQSSVGCGGLGYAINDTGNETGRGGDHLEYDQANWLTSAKAGGTATASYDGDKSLPVVLDDGHVTYFHGLGQAHAVDQSNGLVGVSHADGLGSVRAITDASGNVIETYQSDEFSIPTQTQGSSTQRFQFTGQQR